jgi:hypothetical protein
MRAQKADQGVITQNPSARTNARVTKEAEQDNHEALRRFLNG